MVDSIDVPMLKQVKGLWCPDGNVILTCGDRSFRVYMGMLSQHSAIFRDMFAMPQPSGSTHAGCPVVQLSDDPQHVEYLLRVLYDRSVFNELFNNDFDSGFDSDVLEVAAGIISLAHKYELNNLYNEAVRRLQKMYPVSFSELDSRIDRGPLDYSNCEAHAGLICVINVARRIRTPALNNLLPTPIDGLVRSDDSIEQLSSADSKRCMAGRAPVIC